jgi:hypothetical protein
LYQIKKDPAHFSRDPFSPGFPYIRDSTSGMPMQYRVLLFAGLQGS